jgi:hypothetical protein
MSKSKTTITIIICSFFRIVIIGLIFLAFYILDFFFGIRYNFSIHNKQNEIENLATKYLEEKYNADNTKVRDVELCYSEPGPIPDFKREVPRSGIVYVENKGKIFEVLVSTDWDKYTKKFDTIIADNYQSQKIKNSIKQNIIKKYRITDKYFIKRFEVSSVIGDDGEIGYDWIYRYIYNPDYRGQMSYFTLKQKFDGNIEKFLKNNDYSIKLNILFKGNKYDRSKYFSETKNFFKEINDHFGNGENEINIYTYKEDKYMDSIFKKALKDTAESSDIDSLLYGPAYVYCSVEAETNTPSEVEGSRKHNYGNGLERMEMNAMNYNFIRLDNGISAASAIDNFEFTSKNDLRYVIKNGEDNTFKISDINSLEEFKDKKYDYGVLNKSVYNISYLKKKCGGQDCSGNNEMILEINKSIVPKYAEDLILVTKNKDGSLGCVPPTNSNGYLINSEDSFIGYAPTNEEFIIVYRKKKYSSKK